MFAETEVKCSFAVNLRRAARSRGKPVGKPRNLVQIVRLKNLRSGGLARARGRHKNMISERSENSDSRPVSTADLTISKPASRAFPLDSTNPDSLNSAIRVWGLPLPKFARQGCPGSDFSMNATRSFFIFACELVSM